MNLFLRSVNVSSGELCYKYLLNVLQLLPRNGLHLVILKLIRVKTARGMDQYVDRGSFLSIYIRTGIYLITVFQNSNYLLLICII